MVTSTRSQPFVLLWSLFILSFIHHSSAIVFDLRALSPSSLSRRSSITGTSNSNGTIPLNDKSNTQYVANITVGGSNFAVIVDTGSSDLWITGSVAQTNSLNIDASVQYAVGNANGTINSATVEFAGHTVANQSYLLVPNTSSFSSNLPAAGINGLLGLGPNSGSVIHDKMSNSSTGDSFLDRVFQQDTSTPNYISFMLQRNGNATQPISGQLTIGETISGLDSITSQPQIPVAILKSDEQINQHWTIQLDKNGIIGPDGNAISVSSIVPDNNDRLFAVLDSGFTLPQVPRSVSDAIYGRVQGAIYSEQYNLWTIPCGQELNISFKIGGVTFPVHPLDTSSSDFNLKDANGNEICAGVFQPITSAFSLAGEFDLILGMGFLRNAYTLMDYGDFLDSSSSSVGSPYVQLLSTTVPSTAHAEFVQSRLNGIDTTGSPQYALLPKSKAQSSPVPLDERVQHTEQKIIRYEPEIITACIAVVLILVGVCGWRYVKRRRMRRAQGQQAIGMGSISQPMNFGKSYKPLDEPVAPLRLQTFGGSQQSFQGERYSYNSRR